jgi:hypothetical protein
MHPTNNSVFGTTPPLSCRSNRFADPSCFESVSSAVKRALACPSRPNLKPINPTSWELLLPPMELLSAPQDAPVGVGSVTPVKLSSQNDPVDGGQNLNERKVDQVAVQLLRTTIVCVA